MVVAGGGSLGVVGGAASVTSMRRRSEDGLKKKNIRKILVKQKLLLHAITQIKTENLVFEPVTRHKHAEEVTTEPMRRVLRDNLETFLYITCKNGMTLRLFIDISPSSII